MRIAIIGTGISGLTAAYYLQHRNEVTLFEANSYIGGHTATIDVDTALGPVPVDTGFIVFNDRTYPNFCRLLDELRVESQDTTMSFSVRCDRTGLEYRGADLNGLFAQRRNILNPKFLRLLNDLVRFKQKAEWLLESDEHELTVREFFERSKFSRSFIEHYFLPMGSAVWSCPQEKLLKFPIKFIIDFYDNHGLLGVGGRPQWKVIRGGSKQYVGPLTHGFRERIQLNTPVRSVRRHDDRVELLLNDTSAEFDHVIFACHSDQALSMIESPTFKESNLLGAFKYQPNEVVLHTDTSLLPRTRRAWACWNYHLPANSPRGLADEASSAAATVTYNMNLLQTLKTNETYCVTLNRSHDIDPEKIIRQFVYDHPVFTSAREDAQSRHAEVINQNRSSFCGAYWANGFHEDGVSSALAVCEQLNKAGANEQLHLRGVGSASPV